MKSIKNVLFYSLIICSSVALYSCGSQTKTEQGAKEGKEYTSAYVCPMHCKDSGSENPGKCPVCKMDYVKNKDHAHGHKH